MRKIIRVYWIIINRLKFKFLKVQFGRDLRICNKFYIRIGRSVKIQIGDNFAFSSGAGYNPLSRNIQGSLELEDNAQVTIGNNVGISSSCLWIYESLIVGDGVKIGADCIILDSDAHSLNYIERGSKDTDRPNARKGGIVIESNVLVGTRCIILKGVKIGARSIIGSGSVVTRDVPSDEIWAGNPAKFIRSLK